MKSNFKITCLYTCIFMFYVSAFMWECLYECMYVFICMCIHTCMFIYEYACAYMCVCVFTSVCMCTYMCLWVKKEQEGRLYRSACMHAYMCVCVFTYVCMCVYMGGSKEDHETEGWQEVRTRENPWNKRAARELTGVRTRTKTGGREHGLRRGERCG